MNTTYPHETMGKTLLLCDEGDERRRVYARRRNQLLEVGEFSWGTSTLVGYGAPAHVHCVHLERHGQQGCAASLTRLGYGERKVEELLEQYFAKEKGLLTDFMDDLDAWGVPYGYLNVDVGSHVSYRPARRPRPVVPPSQSGA